MSPLSALRRPRPPAAVLPLLLALLLAVPAAFGQGTDPNNSGGGAGGGGGGAGGGDGGGGSSNTASVGYLSISTGTVPSTVYSFMTGMTSSTVTVIPFSFKSLGTFSLTSTNLLLRSPDSTADKSGVSISVYSTLPTDLTLPTALATFSATGSIGSTQATYTFTADSSPTLAANTTYYLAVTYTGSDDLDWLATTGDIYGNTYPGDLPVTNTYGDGTAFVFYDVTSGGRTDLYDNMGGFSIAASAISAVPEPAAAGVLAAGAILTAALAVRWGRRRSAVVKPDSRSPDAP